MTSPLACVFRSFHPSIGSVSPHTTSVLIQCCNTAPSHLGEIEKVVDTGFNSLLGVKLLFNYISDR